MPIAGGLAILEQVRWFTGVAHANANAGRASSAASSVAVPHVVIGRVVRTRATRQRQHSDQQQDKAQRHWKIRAPFSPPSRSIVIVPPRSSGERVDEAWQSLFTEHNCQPTRPRIHHDERSSKGERPRPAPNRRVIGMSAGLREEPVLAGYNSATLTTGSPQAGANGRGSPAARLRRSCRMLQMPVRPWATQAMGVCCG